MSFMLKYARLCMSTYFRVLSPAKTEAGSDASLLPWRSRSLWGGGRKTSGLHSFVIAAPLRVRQCVCARVSVSVLYKCVLYLKKQPRQSSTRVKGHSNMHLKLRSYTSYGNVQTHVYAVNEVCVPKNAFFKHASNMYIYIISHWHKTHNLMRSTHMMHKQVECIYSKTHTSSILSKCHSC
jgi:hypothetical protein